MKESNFITKTYNKILEIKINRRLLIVIEVLSIALAFYLLAFVNKSNRREIWEFDGSDIRYEYNQAILLSKGENIYEPILSQNLLTNNKYATLLPLYYYFLSGITNYVHQDWQQFLDTFESILFISEMVGGLFIYLFFRRENKRLLGYLAMTFFMFNRWIINNIANDKQDVIAIAILMISLYLFYGKSKKGIALSYFLFGLSLGIKHLSIFIFPIFLLPVLKGEMKIKEFLLNILLFLIPSFGVGIPLMIDNFKAFFYSMLFSFTREPNKLNSDFGYRDILVLYDVGVEKNNIFYYLLPRLPLVFFTLVNLFVFLLQQIPTSLYALTSMFIFIAFNPVLFSQYLTWIPPLLFLVAVDYLRYRAEKGLDN